MAVTSVGDAEIRRVEEMVVKVPLGGLCTEAAVARHRDWLVPRFMDEDGSAELVMQSWIIAVDGGIVVVDPCVGNDRPSTMPMFDRLKTPYIERFHATGIRPDQVTHVFCTHLHCDHCGWNTELRDGRFVPTFPRARYLFSRREHDRWGPRRAEYPLHDFMEGVFERSVAPVIEAGLAELVEGRHPLSTSLTIEPFYGHTAGQSVLHLASRGEEAYFAGDVFHHPLQLSEPELDIGGADDSAQAAESRLRLAGLCAERDALLIPAHFKAPHMGRVGRRDGRFTFAWA